MCLTVCAIVGDLQEERALVTPHIVEHVGDEVAGNGDQRDEVAFVRWFAALDALIHFPVLGDALAQVLCYIDAA